MFNVYINGVKKIMCLLRVCQISLSEKRPVLKINIPVKLILIVASLTYIVHVDACNSTLPFIQIFYKPYIVYLQVII